MNIPAILIANGCAVVLILIVLFSSHRTVRSNMLDSKLFFIMLLCCLFQCIVEPATFLIDGKPHLVFLAKLLNSLLYIDSITFAFIWAAYVDFKLFESTERIRKIYRFIAIPALLVICGSIINLFTPVFFETLPGNIYHRTPLYIIPVLLNYFYLAYGVILVYSYRNKVNKYLFLPAVIFMIPIILSTLLQYLFYGYSFMWIGAAIALTSLYVNVQNEVSYVDSMTGLFTRQYMVQYLRQQFKSIGDEGKMIGIMLDIDHFKSINDTFGHLVGDDAIGAAGQLIRSAMPSKGIAARYAGDEFVIILPDSGELTAQRIIEQIRKDAAVFSNSQKNSYKLTFSSGYGEYRSGDTIDTFLSRMDAAMYEDKRANRIEE